MAEAAKNSLGTAQIEPAGAGAPERRGTGVGAVGLFAVGVARSVSPLMLGGAVCFVAFVLLGLLFFQVPGVVEGVVLTMPNGRPYSIVGLCLS